MRRSCWYEIVWVARNGRIARVKNVRSLYFALASAARWGSSDPDHVGIVYNCGNMIWRTDMMVMP